MKKRKSSSEGSIYQLPSGRWRAQISLHGRRWSATRRTKVEAREWLRLINEQSALGLDYQATQTRLGELIERWMGTKSGHLRPSTLHIYGAVIRLYIIPYLGRYKIGDLTPAIIQAWVSELKDKNAGVRMVQEAHMVLRNCLAHAVQIGMIVRNPADKILLPKPPQNEMKIWTESQVSQFLVAIQGDKLEVLYHLALVTGMRRGELLGLQWKDIDWSGHIQVARQAISLDGGGYTFGEPKTGRGRRSVEIGAGTLEKLRLQLGKVDILRATYRSSWVENDLVFPSVRGGPHWGTNIVKWFRALCAQAGVPVIRFHDLRHTAATIMLSHGIPPVIVAGMLGHTLAVLMARYAHYIPTMQGEAARLMDDITSPILITHELPTRQK